MEFKRRFLFSILIFFGLVSSAHAELSYSLDARARSLPSAANLWGTFAYDGMLWGQAKTSSPLYGYYRIGAKAGGNPSYAAFLQVAPIAPIIFEVQRGDTHRFFDISTLNCDLADCRGKVERTDYSVRVLGAYHDFVFVGSAMWREIRTEQSSKPVGLETEVLVVSQGFHRYFESNLTLAYKLPQDRILGATMANGLFSEGSRKITAAYGFYRFLYQDFSVTLGAGSYQSDESHQSGLSSILLISRSWGEKLSLL